LSFAIVLKVQQGSLSIINCSKFFCMASFKEYRMDKIVFRIKKQPAFSAGCFYLQNQTNH